MAKGAENSSARASRAGNSRLKRAGRLDGTVRGERHTTKAPSARDGRNRDRDRSVACCDGAFGAHRDCGRLVFLDQVEARISHMLKADARIATQAAAKQPRDISRHGRGKRVPVGVVTQHGGDDLGDRPPGKRRASGQHLVEHAPECPHVGAHVHVLALHLLGTHVARGAEDDARRGDRVGRAVARRGGPRRLGEAEVDQLHPSVGRQHDVRRLQVAMDDPLAMCLLEPGDDLRRDADCLVDGEAPRCKRSASVWPSTRSRTRYGEPSRCSNP